MALSTRLWYWATYAQADKDLLAAAKDESNDNTDKLEAALKAGANINVKDIRLQSEINHIGFWYTPLLWAAHNGQLNKVKFLIDKGANIKAKTYRNNTALHLAARQGHNEIFKYLIIKDPKLRSEKGENNLTPDEIAKKYQQLDTVNLCSKEYWINENIPHEMALAIIDNVKDPVTLGSLGSLNKNWQNLFKDDSLKNCRENSFRRVLPVDLQNKTWAEIFKHYYPNETNQPTDPYKSFVDKIHTFYAIGHSYQKVNMYKPFFFYDGYIPDEIRYSEKDVMNYIKEEIKRCRDTGVTLYRTASDAGNVEFASLPSIKIDQRPDTFDAKQFYVGVPPSDRAIGFARRSPIIAVRVSTEVALARLLDPKDSFEVSFNDLRSFKGMTVGSTDRVTFVRDNEIEESFEKLETDLKLKM